MRKLELAPVYAMRKRSGMTATANAIAPKTTISAQWTGKDGKQYREISYWLTEGWSAGFLQVQIGENWQTLY